MLGNAGNMSLDIIELALKVKIKKEPNTILIISLDFNQSKTLI